MICCIHLTMLMYILSNFFSGFLIFNIKKVVCSKQFVLIYKSKDILNAIQYVLFIFFWIFCHINLKFVVELKYPHSNFSLKKLSTIHLNKRCIFLSRVYKPNLQGKIGSFVYASIVALEIPDLST